jgi:hypothetical protein
MWAVTTSPTGSKLAHEPAVYPRAGGHAGRGSIEDRFECGLDVFVRGLATYLTEPLDPRTGWPSGS